MSIGKHVGTGRLVVLGMVVVALALVWGLGAGSQATAGSNVVVDPSLDFSIEAVGEEGCDTTAGSTKCWIQPGTTFTLEVSLNSLPDAAELYEGFDIVIEYSGVTSADNVDMELWPECSFPAVHYEAGLVAFSCAGAEEPIGLGPSTYTGVLMTNDFTCTDSGHITLPSLEMGTTSLAVPPFNYSEGADEVLTIGCGDEPTPTSTAEPEATPGLPPTGAGVDADGGAGVGFWLVVGALLAVGAAGLAVSGLRYARTR